MSWLVPYADLTHDQMRAVEASPERHRLIVGTPGSGKTLVLLHRAARLQKLYKVSKDRFRIFVYTNVLKRFIQAGCEDLGIPIECVSTYDHWCKEYFEASIGGRLPWDSENKQPKFDEIRARVAEDVRKHKQKLYDFVMVDEAQDLDTTAFEVFRTIAFHVTAAADRKQQLYEHGTDEDSIAERLGLGRRNHSLLEAFRCSPYIVALASVFLPDVGERSVWRAQTRTDVGERETPVLLVARDLEEERRRLVDVVRERLLEGERIAILLPTARQVHGFRKALEEFGLDAEVQGRGEVLDFTNTRPKLLTYHSAKGLTFDSVLLPRLVTGSFRGRNDSLSLRMMFVAVTRAVRWVYMSTEAGKEPPFLARVRALSSSGELTLRDASEHPCSSAVPPARHPPSPGGLDELF